MPNAGQPECQTATMMRLAGTPKFIVGREAWRGDYTYHVCPCRSDVFGINKAQRATCPGCGKDNPEDIFSAMDRRLRMIPHFLESMRVVDGPYGRYRDNRDDPRPYSLRACEFALSLGNQLVWSGYDSLWNLEQLSDWIDTILMDLNPQTGLIEAPHEIAEKGRTEQVIFEQYCLSRGLAACFRRSGFADRYQLPEQQMQDKDMFRDHETAIAFLEDRTFPSPYLKGSTWSTQPWSKGAQVTRALSLHRHRLAMEGLEDDDIETLAHDWLNAFQDERTGYWGGQQANLNNTACGAFKVLTAYVECQWPIPHPKRLIDTTLAMADDEGGFGLDDAGNASFGCTQFDPLMILCVAMQAAPGYRTQDIYNVTAQSYLNVVRHWSDEEHFFSPPESTNASMVGMLGFGTVMYMAEILLGIEILKPDR